MELYPSRVEKNLSGCDMLYSPNPTLPSKPCTEIISNTGRGKGADVHGCMPASLDLGMKISGESMLGMRSGSCADKERKVEKPNIIIAIYFITQSF